MLKHKKFLAMLLTLAMVLSLAACGGKKETPAETPAETPTEAPAESELNEWEKTSGI